jgi:hypothetical protein
MIFAKKVVTDFEVYMNDDLNVQGAFDSLSENLSLIWQKREVFTACELKNILENLRRIDCVLKCLF